MYRNHNVSAPSGRGMTDYTIVVSTSAWYAAGRGSIMCKNLALDIRDYLSLRLSEETLKAVVSTV